MQWNPRRLPRMRQQMAAYLQDPDTDMARDAPRYREEIAALGRQLRPAELYWVAPDMAALAVSSADQLPDLRFLPSDRPADVGLIVFDGGAGALAYQGAEIPIDALSWGPDRGGMRLWQWIRRTRVEEALHRQGGELAAWLPPLIPVFGGVLDVATEPSPVAELPEDLRTSATTLAAAWHLMAQPRLVDRDQLRPDKAERRALARAGSSASDVTLVDLRRQYVPQTQDQEPGGAKRQYRHRFVVSGHWRDQAHGPERSLRRRTWIPSYLKGPDGAPLLATTRVNVWRR